MMGFANRLLTRVCDPQIERQSLVAILILAIVARCVFAALFPEQSRLLADAANYRLAALDIASGHLIANEYVMPGYPLLVALTGPGIGQLCADILLSVASVWGVSRVAREISGDPFSGLVAAAMLAIYPFSLFYAVAGLTETLFCALFFLGFLAFYRGAFLVGSVAMTASILTRPAVELLTPWLILTFALVVQRSGWRQALLKVGVFAVVYIAMMSPWWWHNETKYGQFVRLNLATGIVLYAGNNELNKTGGGITPTDYDAGKFGDIADPIARDRAYRDAAIRHMSENPRQTVCLMWLKFERLWRPWPYAAELKTPLLTIISAVTAIPLFIFALAGLAMSYRQQWRALVPIIMFIGFTTATHMITIGSVRYRYPIDLFLVVLAAPAVASTVRRILACGGPDRTEVSSI